MKWLSAFGLSLSIILVACETNVQYVTKQGVTVIDPSNLGEVYGWTIDRAHMTKCLDAMLPYYPEINIDGLTVAWEPYPFLRTNSAGETDFVYGLHYTWHLRIALQPSCASTAIAHELMHHWLEQTHFFSDPEHKLEMYWEGGIVGEVDDKLRAAGL